MEIEAKFVVPDTETFQRLRAMDQLAGLALSPGHVKHAHDTYLDTRDRLMLAAGYACRRREQDGNILMTIKAVETVKGAIHRREELEVALPGDQPPADWPASSARDKVVEIIGQEALLPLFDLHQTRTVRQVSRENQPMAELSLDEVRVAVGSQALEYFELEIELKPGGAEDDLAAIAQVLQDEWNLVPGLVSKFERALNLVDAGTARPEAGVPAGLAAVPTLPAKPGLAADDSMAEAARKTLAFHFQRMLAHEPGTRLGQDIEELHDMRVATRRMRAALRVFGDYLDPKVMKPFARALRRTGRALGAVRDLDVFRDKVLQYFSALPAERRAELDPLLAVWQAERDLARDHMLAFLDSPRYARFKEEFGQFLQTPGAGALPGVTAEGEPLPHRVRHIVPIALYQGLSFVRAYDQDMHKPDVPLERFHQLRIAFKGLRYTLEFFQEVLGPKSKPLINKVKQLQDHLGDLQDAVVACDVLRNFLMWGTWRPGESESSEPPAPQPPAPGVTAYLAYRQAEIQRLIDTFPPVWEPIRDSEFSRQLAALVAAL